MNVFVATVTVSDHFAACCFAISFPSLYDPKGEVALAFRDYPANAIPSTIILDRDGRVAAVYTGAVQEDDLRTVLDELLREA